MRPGKRLAVLGLLGAIAALAIVGTSLAQTAPATPTPGPGKAGYVQYFLDRLASALNIDRGTLDNALKQAKSDTLDRAVQDGRLSQQDADNLKAKPGLAPWNFGKGIRPGRGKQALPRIAVAKADLMSAVAKALDLSVDDLATQLRSGKSLKDLAQGKEGDVEQAILGVMKQRLDQAVANGGITQEQADRMYEKMKNSDLLSNGWGAAVKPGRGKPGQSPAPSGTWNRDRAPTDATTL